MPRIEAVDFFYLAMPVVTDEADGSQDALLVRVAAGGHVGWGVNVGLGQIFNLGQISSPEVMYRYTVQTNPNETFIVQTGDEFNVNDCVTLWQRTNDATYPRIRINSSCTLPR